MIRKPLALPDLMLRSPSPNRNQIAAHIAVAPNIKLQFPSALRFVFVCFTNRCGSAYLGDLLASTGRFQHAGESFNSDEVLALCREHGLASFADYFAQIVRRDARDDRYIVKVAPEQLRLLVEAGILGQIIEQSEFLHVSRADKLAQSISRSIAEQNNRWAWDSPVGLSDDKLVYSPVHIAEHVEAITNHDRCFALFFALNGIVPIEVRYERLVSQPQQELDEVARRLGLPSLQVDPTKLRYRRQANEVNETWRTRFLLETELPGGVSFAGAPTGQTATIGAPAHATATVQNAVKADLLAHVHNIGDITGDCGDWIGKPKSGLWIEGFSITPRQGIAAQDIEYQASQNNGLVFPWISGGGFCGTRGLSMPLQGMRVCLRGAAEQAYECLHTAAFLDGSTVGPVAAGQLCQSASMAPLEAFQIVIRPKSR